jgi:hypothetical protein
VVVKGKNGAEILTVDKDVTLLFAMDLIKATTAKMIKDTNQEIKVLTIFQADEKKVSGL